MLNSFEKTVYVKIKQRFNEESGDYKIVDFTSDYPSYKSTLDKLELLGVIRDMGIDNGSIYMLESTFDSFDAQIADYLEDIERSNKTMGFEYLDSECEKQLREILNAEEFSLSSASTAIRFLIENDYLNGCMTQPYGQDATVTCIINGVSQKGKSYFELKERYEKQLEMSRPNVTHISTGDNSPVNLAVDGSTATQTVDYANNEQIKALSSLANMVNSAREFTEEERAEILELIDGAKSATQTGKKAMLKTLMTGLGIALTKAPSFIVDKWEDIKEIFGGE